MSSSPITPASPGNPPWSSRSRPVLVGGGKRIVAEDVARMFKALTGKDSTPEQLDKSQKKLDEAYARLAASQQDTPDPAQPIAHAKKMMMTEAGLVMAPVEDAEGDDE